MMDWRHERHGSQTRLVTDDGRYTLTAMGDGFRLCELVPYGPEGKGRAMQLVTDQRFRTANDASAYLEGAA